MTSSSREVSVQSTPWSVLIDGPQSGPLNMALDETLLDEVSKLEAEPQTYLRFYQWIRPTLSLGFSQKPERVVDLEYCNLHGIDMVRRLTGGKAVLHDRELTYSVISNDPAFFPIADISKTYCRIARALQTGFLLLGVDTTLAPGRDRSTAPGPLSAACFAVSNHHEILWRNRKIAGSAQRRTQNAFLQHGSILIEFDADQLARTLRSCDIASLRTTVTDLKSCLGSMPAICDVTEAMWKGFETAFRTQFVRCELNRELFKRAHQLAGKKLSVQNSRDLRPQPSKSA